MRARLLLMTLFLATGTAMAAQQPSAELSLTTGVDPDTVTIGERFRVGIRASVPPGVTLRFPELEDGSGTVQLYEPARTVRDPSDAETQVHVYPLVAWRTEVQRPIVAVELGLPDGATRLVWMELPLPHVRSVLPAESSDLQPRGHRGIIEARLTIPFWPLLLLLLALLLLALAVWLWLRRRRSTEPFSRNENPREWALAELDRARRRLWEPADQRPFFSGVSQALRAYLAALQDRWGADLTTRELIRALAAEGVESGRRTELEAVLATADRVKFARLRLTEPEADAVWRAAREWVETAPDAGTGAAPDTEAPREAA
jgi:hypothetical protein